MGASKFSLDQIEVPEPCTVPWATMTGTSDRVRHCGQCRKHVYHLSNMTRVEAEALVLEKEGDLCVQFYRRADGTVVTQNCAAVRCARAFVSAVAVAGLSILALLGMVRMSNSGDANSTFSFVGGGPKPPTGAPSTTPSPNNDKQETCDPAK